MAALTCPASAINAIDGQAVFLVAALIVGGFGLLERRPYLGGLVLGLLTFKPQFCILVPIALIAAGQWRALLASGLSALAMMIASGLIFGWDLWLRWIPLIIENLVSPSEKWIEFGRMWGHSVYTCAVLLGAPERLASWIQLLATLGAAVSVIIAFRSRLGTREKTAVFLAATVLAAPHSGPYDVTLLVIAAAFWLMSRSAPLPLWCWTLAFMIWLLPMLSPPLLFPRGQDRPAISRPADRAAAPSRRFDLGTRAIGEAQPLSLDRPCGATDDRNRAERLNVPVPARVRALILMDHAWHLAYGKAPLPCPSGGHRNQEGKKDNRAADGGRQLQ